jgi:predicted TIM-barrel enzyme
VGSGVTPETLDTLLPHASGFIVGTWVKRDGRLENPVDPDRVRVLAGRVQRTGSV